MNGLRLTPVGEFMLLQDRQKSDEETVGSLAGVKPCSQHIYSASLSAKVTTEEFKGVKNKNKTLHPNYIYKLFCFFSEDEF